MRHLLILFFLASCSSGTIKRGMDNASWDSLKEESFLRYSSGRKDTLSPTVRERYTSILKCYEGDINGGLEDVKESLKGKAAGEDSWIATGLCHYLGGQYVKASYFFGLLLSQSKSDWQKALAHNNLGIIQMKMKRFEDSLFHFDKAVEISPTMVAPQFNRIQLYLHFHHYSKALKLASDLSKRTGKDGELILAKVIALYHLGDPNGVLKEISPLPQEMRNRQDIGAFHAAALFKLKKYHDARKVLDEMDKSGLPEFKDMAEEISRKVNREIELIEEREG